MGAGGAALTAVMAAAKHGAAVRIIARSAVKAEAVAELTRDRFPRAAVSTYRFAEDDMCRVMVDTDILINATPLGMSGVDADFASFAFLERLPGHALVSDMIYDPARTRLLARAGEIGLALQNGLAMLIRQALGADALFFGSLGDTESLYEYVEQCYAAARAVISQNL
jgi:shikimate dehydrogenase